MFASAGRTVQVRGPAPLDTWWPSMSPQIPGTSGDPLAETADPAALVLPEEITARDARLQINAHLHGEHLRVRTLSVHGVAVRSGDQAILLLGDHGAGKSVTALALMADRGWRQVAGDTCLLRVEPGERGVLVAGGTRAFVVRRGMTGHWFPGLLPETSGDSESLDVATLLTPPPASVQATEPALVLAVFVRVDDREPDHAPCDSRTARNVVYRASSYLIDKILDDPGAAPLRLAETPALAHDRVALARKMAASVPIWMMRGAPHLLAAEIDRLATDRSAAR